jgi:hypothetical protein
MAVAHVQPAFMASLAHRHTAALDSAIAHTDAHRDHSPAGPAERAPLQALKKMIASVTEFLMAPSMVIAAVAIALTAVPRMRWRRQAALDIPTPPPRAQVAVA